jgi:hypothetical protein
VPSRLAFVLSFAGMQIFQEHVVLTAPATRSPFFHVPAKISSFHESASSVLDNLTIAKVHQSYLPIRHSVYRVDGHTGQY